MKIYVDTSVIGGMYDEEFEEYSNLFFQEVIKSHAQVVISSVLKQELEGAPAKVREFVGELPSESVIHIDLTAEAITLGMHYIEEEVVGPTSEADCFHIALATIHRCDLLVSWNFKHIVNVVRIRGYNGVNLINGYPTLEIRNPREAFDYENNN